MVQETSEPKNLKKLLKRRYRFKARSYFQHGWKIFKENWLLLVAYFAVVASITAALIILALWKPSKLSLTSSLILGFALFPPLWAGFFQGIFTFFQTGRLKLPDFFRSFSNIAQLIVANLLAAVLIFVGCFVSLIFIPGLYLIVGYLFLTPLIIDRRLKFWSAMETSRLIIAKQWFRIFAFVVLLGLMNIGGALIFGLGLFVTIPLSYCAIAAAYDDIIGLAKKPSMTS
ncbi:MAG: hypothetical protein SW833_23975 [Cyanobacteriota bacterium]|nr:hypothetical protein [Cyanobacteriota bacterium]